MSKRWEKKGVFCWMDGLMDHDGDGHAASQTMFSARTLSLLSAFSLFLVAWSTQQLVVDGCLSASRHTKTPSLLPSLLFQQPSLSPGHLSPQSHPPPNLFSLLSSHLLFFFLPFFVTPR
ncbi:hypothetical protein HDK64DRAFT_276387 [Phyllosticta capitalensis]